MWLEKIAVLKMGFEFTSVEFERVMHYLYCLDKLGPVYHQGQAGGK